MDGYCTNQRSEVMDNLLEERVHRLELSVGRLRKGVDLLKTPAEDITTNYFLRTESSICLRRALALWWGLRWGRK